MLGPLLQRLPCSGEVARCGLRDLHHRRLRLITLRFKNVSCRLITQLILSLQHRGKVGALVWLRDESHLGPGARTGFLHLFVADIFTG